MIFVIQVNMKKWWCIWWWWRWSRSDYVNHGKDDSEDDGTNDSEIDHVSLLYIFKWRWIMMKMVDEDHEYYNEENADYDEDDVDDVHGDDNI